MISFNHFSIKIIHFDAKDICKSSFNKIENFQNVQMEFYHNLYTNADLK